MADVQVNDIVRIGAIMSYQGSEFENVHHFKVIVNNTVDDATFMVDAQAIIDSIYSPIFVFQSILLDYVRTEGQNLTQDLLLPQTAWLGSPSGTDGNNPLPAQVAAMVYWPTLRPKTRCSTYIPALTEVQNNATGTWVAALVAALQTFGNIFAGDISSADVSLRKGAYNRPLDRFTDIVSAIVPADSRTQRRRRSGVGI